MTETPRWNRCIYHRGPEFTSFLEDHLATGDRRALLIAGAGFDPRSVVIAERLAGMTGCAVAGFFFREQRPNPHPALLAAAEANQAELQRLVPEHQVHAIEIFATNANVVGGRRAVEHVNAIDLASYSDVFVDLSALSIGVAFPVIRFLHEHASRTALNLHLVVTDEPATDVEIKPLPGDTPTTIHGFRGAWELDAHANAARLWMPQLSANRRAVLELIHARVVPHAVCPVLPFPASAPRLSDALIEHYGELFENPWKVDARDIVYASERSPIDLYRTILRIDEARKRVFAATGGSQIILSPVGSKALALGALMAALERDFTIMYVESLGFNVDFSSMAGVRQREESQAVHIWLDGEVYAAKRMETIER